MGQTTVLQFASELGLPAELLLEQLKSAGVNKATSSDQLTEADKTLLLEYLRKEHGAQAPKNKITLTRKQNTEIKKTDSTGKARTIQVEVRKKRVLVRNEEAAAEQQPVVEPVIEEPIEEPVLVAEPEVIAPAEELVEAVVAESAEPPAKSKKSLLTPEQIEQREQEAKRHAALMAMQMEDVRKKQELTQRRQEEEAKRAAEAAASATKLSEGTLHKPAKDAANQRKKALKKVAKIATKIGLTMRTKNAALKRAVTFHKIKVGVVRKLKQSLKIATLNMHLMHRQNLLFAKC